MKGITIGLILAAFGVGIGLGYLLGQDGDSSSRSGRTVVERPAAATAPMSARETQSLREMLDRIPVPTPARGAGRITGTVRNKQGDPITGVLVVALPIAEQVYRKSSRAPSAPSEPDLVKMVEESVRRVRARRAARVEARSGADGAFALEGIGSAEQSVQAYAEGYRFRPGKAKAGGSVDLVGEPVIRVDVDVVVEGSGPPERANILVRSSGGPGGSQRIERWSRLDPWIEIAPGRYEFTAALQGELGGKSPPQTVTFKAGESPPLLRFMIKMMPALRVTVARAPMLQESRLYGWVIPWKRETFPSAQQLRSHNKQKWVQGGQHQLTWKELKVGRYCVGVAYAWQQEPVMRLVELGGGLNEEAIELPEPSGPGFLKLRLLDPEGEPVHAEQWMYYRSHKGGSSSGGISPLRRSDGVLLMPIGDDGQFKNGTHRLEATHAVHGSLSLTFEPGTKEILDLRYEQACQPVGTIRGYAGNEYQDRIRFRWHEPGKEPPHVWFHGESLIEDDGTMRLPPQQPGTRVLALYVSSNQNSWMRIAQRELNLRPGKQDVSIDMPALHKLRIVWAGEPKKQTFALRPRNERAKRRHYSAQQMQSDAHGVVVFDGLPAGRYEVQKYGAALKENPIIEIPATSELRLP
ncbi:MAG: hypothetical protein AAGD14_05585 [Planctomycetota bacterium]